MDGVPLLMVCVVVELLLFVLHITFSVAERDGMNV